MVLRGRDVADCVDCQVEAVVMDDDVHVIDMADALTTIRMISDQIESIGDFHSAVEARSDVTANVNGDDLQASDQPFTSPRRA